MDDILLIDDDRLFHGLFAAHATRVGCDILHAYDGLEGEQMALSHNPILVVLDIMIPKQDGYTTAQNLRAQGYHGAISMTSALHGATGTRKVYECGANGYLMKPPNPATLALHLNYARSDMKYPTVAEWLEQQ